MWMIRALVAVVTSAAVGLVSGCSASSSGTSRPAVVPRTPTAGTASAASMQDLPARWLSSSFRQQANTICGPAEQQQVASPFPYPTFNAASPDPIILPKIDQWAEGQTALGPALSRLIALTPHEKNAQRWSPVVAALKAFRTKKREQQAVAAKADAAAFAADTHVLSAIISGLENDLIEAGFQPSDDCYTVFSG